MQKILVTGGSGYIGSHICVELLANGHEVVVLDNLSNSSQEAVRRVESIAGRAITFVRGDILDETLLRGILQEQKIDAVIHLAGLKAVGESVAYPLRYYHNNVSGSRALLQAMADTGVKSIVFSSSATVYGDPASNPVDESAPLGPTNPYGRSKLQVEEMLGDLAASNQGWRIVILRYFNPVGAHASGLIGEHPLDTPNNLMPYVSRVAAGKLERLSVFGNDYPTPDGTGVRDYIHVVDLALGHVSALASLPAIRGCEVYNLGTGRGYSVLEIVQAFERTTGDEIPYAIAGRRPGDIAECYANPGKAERDLGWRANRNLDDMCLDAWRWQEGNPDGYS